MAGELTSPLSCSCADHSQLNQTLYLFQVRLISFMLFGIRLSVNHLVYFMLPKIVCIVVKRNFHSDVWLTVHRNSVWIRNQLDVTLCYPLFLLYKLLNMVAPNMLSNL